MVNHIKKDALNELVIQGGKRQNTPYEEIRLYQTIKI